MGSMSGGGGMAPAPAPVAVAPAPAPIVWQGDDPFAPNYRPPTGAQLSPAQKAAEAAKAAAARPLAPAEPIESEEDRLVRQRRSALILGGGFEGWGGGDPSQYAPQGY